jgi:Holliday junction resolvasome RuvABC endonuclease subunit
MQRAIQSVFNLKDPPEPPDVADALAVALCCGLQLSRESEQRIATTEAQDLDAVENI